MFATAVALVALSRGSHMRSSLQAELDVSQRREIQLLARAGSAERELRYYRMLARRALLDSSVVVQGRVNSSIVALNLAKLPNPLVMYSIDTRCAACVANFSVVSEIVSSVRCSVDFLGVVAGDDAGIDTLWPHAPKGIRIMREASGSVWEVLPLAVIPSLVVVGQPGRVLGWWSGLVSPADRAAASAALNEACELSRVTESVVSR